MRSTAVLNEGLTKILIYLYVKLTLCHCTYTLETLLTTESDKLKIEKKNQTKNKNNIIKSMK